jgi:hypothetical protein
MRPRLRLATTICLTICFIVLSMWVMAFVAMDRAADVLISCLDGDIPVGTVEAQEGSGTARCSHSTDGPTPSAP